MQVVRDGQAGQESVEGVAHFRPAEDRDGHQVGHEPDEAEDQLDVAVDPPGEGVWNALRLIFLKCWLATSQN